MIQTMRSFLASLIIFLGTPLIISRAATTEKEVWNVADILAHLDTTTQIYGVPKAVVLDGYSCGFFNGSADAITVAKNPFLGATSFTIQVLIKPDSTGKPAQRFIHLEDKARRRLMVELRITDQGQWAMDTFLNSDKGSHPLLDMAYVHSCDQWHWACLVYNGHTMTSYVDGKKELSYDLPFSPMIMGSISIGSRLNHIYWFKGAIADIQFDRKALDVTELHQFPSQRK